MRVGEIREAARASGSLPPGHRRPPTRPRAQQPTAPLELWRQPLRSYATSGRSSLRDPPPPAAHRQTAGRNQVGRSGLAITADGPRTLASRWVVIRLDRGVAVGPPPRLRARGCRAGGTRALCPDGRTQRAAPPVTAGRIDEAREHVRLKSITNVTRAPRRVEATVEAATVSLQPRCASPGMSVTRSFMTNAPNRSLPARRPLSDGARSVSARQSSATPTQRPPARGCD